MPKLSLFLIFAATLYAQPRRTVFIITDAEGVAGVCRQDQTDPKDQEMRQLLTGEINAAVTGLLNNPSKVDEVIVWDGHDGSQTLSALTIHASAKLLGEVGRDGEHLLALLERLERDGQGLALGFAQQQMNVVRHDDISIDAKFEAAAHAL